MANSQPQQPSFTADQVQRILSSADLKDKARIFEGTTQKPFSVQKIALALDNEKLDTAPQKVGFPFKSCWVESATDSSVEVYLIPTTMDLYQSPILLTQNASIDFDEPIAQAFLYWSAQSGKMMKIVFSTNARFRTGSLISQINGGVQISEGSVASAIQSVNLSAATAAIIAPQSSTRVVSTIQNKTGGDLFVGGDDTVTDDGTLSTAGIKYASDSIIIWKNTAALYGYSVGGGRVNRMDET
ncbi:MAG: hypothetical protein KGL39_33190 [Patescibacteria group bacterium]|nr:hypothetical protein [Patescibacteria group bacterium]